MISNGLARKRCWHTTRAQLVVIMLFGSISPTLASSTNSERVTQVGPVRATVALTPEKPLIGDEIVLEITVESEPGIELLMPEFGEALERYTIVDFVPKQHIDGDGKSVMTQRYTLQPFLSGEQSIPPILIEFIDHRPGQQPSPDDFDAYELLTERIDFQVQSVLPDSAVAELKPPLGELAIVSPADRSQTRIIVAVVLGLLGLIAVGWLWSRQTGKRILRRNAYELARDRVDRLVADRQSTAPSLTIEQFYVEISAVVRQYLENRFELRAPELTTDEFLQLAAAGGELSNEHQLLLAEFLSQADRVKFASGTLVTGATCERDVVRSCELAVKFLEETRENAPDVEVTEEVTAEDISDVDADNLRTTNVTGSTRTPEVSRRV